MPRTASPQVPDRGADDRRRIRTSPAATAPRSPDVADAGAPAGGGGGGFANAYPQRPPADPAVVERGKALYGANCAFCHGQDARGGRKADPA